MKLKPDIKDLKYGCFNATLNCTNCNKILVYREFSWDNDHIGTSDSEKIMKIFRDMLHIKEMNYCPRCGTILRDEEQET